MSRCKHIEKCKFYNRYKQSLDSNCKMYIAKYCLGCGEQSCMRFEFRKANGFSADPEYTPTGGVVIELEDAK